MLILYIPPNQQIPIPDGVDPSALISFLLLVGQIALTAVRQRGFNSKERWEKQKRDEEKKQKQETQRQQAAQSAREETASLFERLLASYSGTIVDLRDRLQKAEAKRDSFLEEKALLEDEWGTAVEQLRDCQREKAVCVEQIETYRIRYDMLETRNKGYEKEIGRLERERLELQLALKQKLIGDQAPANWDTLRMQTAAIRAILVQMEQQMLAMEQKGS